MISGAATKIRLVICPKCRKLLPEVAEFPIYQCGGCGVHLRAKNRGNSAKTIPSDLHETDSLQRNGQVHASEDNKSSSSSEGAIPSSTGECSLDKKDGRDDLGDCCTEQPEVKLSNGVSSATKQPEDVNFSDKVPSSMEQPGDMKLSNEFSSPMKLFDDVNNSGEHSSYNVQTEGVNFSNEVSSPMERPGDMNISNEGSSSNMQHEEVNSSNEVSSPTENPEGVNISNEGSSSNVQPEDVKFSNKVSSLVEQPEDVSFSNQVSSLVEQPEDVSFSNQVSSLMEQPEDAFSNEVPSATEQPEDAFSNEVPSATEHPEEVNFSNEVSSSLEQPQDVDYTDEVSSPKEQSEDVDFSDEVPSPKEQSEDVDFSDEVSSPKEQSEDVDFSDEVPSPKEQSDDVDFLDEVSSPKEQSEDVDFSDEVPSPKEQSEDVDFSDEVPSPKEQSEDVDFSDEVSSPKEQPEGKISSNEVSSLKQQPPDNLNFLNEVSLSMEKPKDVYLNEVSLSAEKPEDVSYLNEVSLSAEKPEDVSYLNEVSLSMEKPEDMSYLNEVSLSTEKPEDMIPLNEVSFSTELMSHENEEPQPIVGTNLDNLDEVSSPKEQSEDVDFSDEVSSPKEQSEDIDFSDEVSSPKEQPEGKNSSNEVSSLKQQPSDNLNFWNEGSLSTEKPEDVSYLNEVSLSTEKPEDVSYLNEVSLSMEKPEHGNYLNEVSLSTEKPEDVSHLNEVSLSKEKPGDVSHLNEVSFTTELMSHENEEPQPIVGTNLVDEDDEGGCYSRSLSSDSILASKERNSEVTVQRITEECMEPAMPIFRSIVQPEPSDDGFEWLRSMDTLENTEMVNLSSELSGTLGYMYRSPTSRSFYGYEGSVSSYDGTDDQVLDRPLHQPNRTFRARKFVGPEDRSRRKFLVNSNLEMQSQARNPSSILSDKEHYPRKYSKWNRDDFLESTNYDQPVRNWRLERGEFPSRFPFSGSDFPAGYENDNPLSPVHPDYRCSSSFHSPNKPEFHEQERIKLLKLVYELQDEITRTNNVRGPTGVSWKGKHIARSYNHEASEEEIFNDLKYPRYPDQYRTGRNWSQHAKFSRMAFSGEAPNSRHQADFSCLHCCPRDRWYSAQLPPPVPHKNGLHGAYPGHRCYHHCTSTHSSPLQSMETEIPIWPHGAKSEDQGHKNHEAKLYRKEKRNQVKRHIQPIAGGAPFLTCYLCSHLLQLPADFLLFKRRCHGLRCAACYGLLKFSVENRTHIVRYIPNSVDPPPPSEVDDISRTLNSVGLASTALVNDCSSADPVSCSDDYGLSFCKSFSTVGEPAFSTPPFEQKDDRNKKFFLKRSLNKYKKPWETGKSIRPSSNMSKPEKSSTEIKELPPTTGSPLYRLMDYSSPNALIFGSGTDSD